MNNMLGFEDFINEGKDDEGIYLSPKQRNLPDALKKGIIAKNKKAGRKYGEKKDDCECVKESTVELNEAKNDEEIYLSPKQRKLPDGLKNGIIARNKKLGKKYGEKKEE